MLVMVSHERWMALVCLPLSFRTTQFQRRTAGGLSRRCLNSTNELAARRDIGSFFYGRTLVCARTHSHIESDACAAGAHVGGG